MTERFLELYCERIGYAGALRADLPTLRAIHLLHLQRIAFENIDVFCHRAPALDQDSLVEKLLLRRRGGYCFEQNGLFLCVLRAIGFRCHPNLARVHHNRPQPGGRTHHVNLVELDGDIWLCDVGFGGPGVRHPLPLRLNVEFEQMREIYQLRLDAVHGYCLLKLIRQEWQPLYTFKIEPALSVDLQIGNFYTANSSQAIFRNAILGMRMTAQGRVTLNDRTFKRFDFVAETVE